MKKRDITARKKKQRRQARVKRRSQQEALNNPLNIRNKWEEGVIRGFAANGRSSKEARQHTRNIRKAPSVVREVAYGMSAEEYVSTILGELANKNISDNIEEGA